MKTLKSLLFLGLLIFIGSCQKENVEIRSDAVIDSEQITNTTDDIGFRGNSTEYYNYWIAADNKAEANNGEVMSITPNTGFPGDCLSVKPKTAEGDGTFVHTDADGNVLGFGTWTVTGLLNFRDAGNDPCCPNEWRAGKASMNIHLVGDGGSPQFDAILTVYCRLPNISLPASWPEGIKLNILGGKNFSNSVGGGTLFIYLPDGC